MSDLYASSAWLYRQADWQGVLPLPPGKKSPPPDGYTGWTGIWPSGADIQAWTEDRPGANVALRLPHGVLGLDVDAYGGKPGAATLSALTAELGPLPPTWTSTSRDDGQSAIRFFRVPDMNGRTWVGSLPGIETIHVGHRYAVVWPSVHPEGRTYRWHRPDGLTSTVPPSLSDLGELPPAWLDRLTETGERRISAGLSNAGVQQWLTTLRPGPLCDGMTSALSKAVRELQTTSQSWHDFALRRSLALTLFGAEGHRGARDALEQFGDTFVAGVTSTHRGGSVRSPDAARAEYVRLVVGAVDKATSQHPQPAQQCACDRLPVHESEGTTETMTSTEQAPSPEVLDDEPGEREWAAEIASSFTPLDWHAVWEAVPEDIPWLVEPMIERGRLYAFFSPAKAGKSLLLLEIAAALAAGRPLLGNTAAPPVCVLYVDLENTAADLVERLSAYGYGPDDLKNLVYHSFPNLAALDSRLGGQQLTALAVHNEAELVIIDTVSRVIAGKENDSDTFHALYRYALAPLKKRGITVVRLDHAGKEESRGQRGSSSKDGDVDTVWKLTKTGPTTLLLERTASRTPHGPERIQLARRFGPLRHEITREYGADASTDAGIIETIEHLARLAVPLDAGRDVCRKALTSAQIKVSNNTLTAVVRRRKTCPGQVEH